MADIQIYDAKFTKNEANVLYNNLINSITTKPPYFNSSYRTKFTQSTNEKWDMTQFFITKRPWFVSVPLYNRNLVETELAEETEEEWLSWDVLDLEVVDGYRYFLIENNEWNKVRLYKQIRLNQYTNSGNDCLSDIKEGYIVNITHYQDYTYFPTASNVDKRFLLTTYVKGKAKYESSLWKAVLRNKDGMLSSYLYNADDWSNDVEVGGSVGDYVLPFSGQVAWSVQVIWAKRNAIYDTQKWVSLATTWYPSISSEWEENIVEGIHYKVFEDYGLTLHFVTSDWLVHRHHDADTPSSFEYTISGETYFNTHDNETEPRMYIHCISEYGEWTIFLNSKWALFLWGEWFNKFFYSWLDIIQTTGVYEYLDNYMWQILLMWPKTIWMLIYDFNTKRWDIVKLVENGWMFWKYAFWKQDNKFFYVRDTKDFYQLQLQFGYWSAKPAIELGYRSWFLNTDLEMLQRIHDKITVFFSGNNTYMFLNDWSDRTKILYYDLYYWIRQKRYTNGIKLSWYKHGVFFWKWVFSNEWTTDNWNDITQIVTMTFWDQTHANVKHLHYTKMPIWYNSYLTKNSSVRVTALSDWREVNIAYNKLGTSAYVANLLKINLDQDTINNEEFAVRSYPIWVELYSAKWVAFEKREDTLTAEMIEYLSTVPYAQDTDQQNTFTLAKMWVIKIPIGLDWNVFTIEVICKWSDRLEFGGFVVWFQYTDNDMTRMENIVTDGVVTGDSWYSTTTPMYSPDKILS